MSDWVTPAGVTQSDGRRRTARQDVWGGRSTMTTNESAWTERDKGLQTEIHVFFFKSSCFVCKQESGLFVDIFNIVHWKQFDCN